MIKSSYDTDIGAIADKNGKISLLTEINLKENRRALVTILDETPNVGSDSSVKMPTNEAVHSNDVLNLWTDRKESAQEIARDIRSRNRKIT